MKKYKVIYSPHALIDLEDAVYYYNEQQKGLGKRFAAQVQLALKAIKANPHFASFRYEDVRVGTMCDTDEDALARRTAQVDGLVQGHDRLVVPALGCAVQ